MNEEEFHAELIKEGCIVGDVKRYQHVERFGSREVEGLLDGKCIVQEKIDGANLTVATLPNEGMIIGTRRRCIYREGDTKNSFRGAVEYVLGHKGLVALMEDVPGWTLRGEIGRAHV